MMKLSDPQYISDKTGKKISVILPYKQYEKILDELEELQDIRSYDAVKARKEKSILLDDYVVGRSKKK